MVTMSQPAGGDRTARLNNVNREIIKTLLSWSPYGDPPEEDLIMRFGMSISQSKSHVSRLIEQEIDADTDPHDRTLLVRVAKLLGCSLRLAPTPVLAVGKPAREPLNFGNHEVQQTIRRRFQPRP
jgi:hypothetical protein